MSAFLVDRPRQELARLRAENERLRRLVWGAVHNAPHMARHGTYCQGKPLWAVLKSVFGVGGTWASRLCVEFGRDPDEVVPFNEPEEEEEDDGDD